jgi:hypothetical protein
MIFLDFSTYLALILVKKSKKTISIMDDYTQPFQKKKHFQRSIEKKKVVSFRQKYKFILFMTTITK